MSKFSIEIDEIDHEISRIKTDHLQLMKDFNSDKDEVKEQRKKCFTREQDSSVK